MASVDSSYVRDELRAVARTSNVVKKLLWEALEKLEEAPESFEELQDVPPDLKVKYPEATFRKIYIEHRRHSFRLIFIHWQIEPDDHVDIIYAFPRKKGYAIDWEWVDEVCGRGD